LPVLILDTFPEGMRIEGYGIHPVHEKRIKVSALEATEGMPTPESIPPEAKAQKLVEYDVRAEQVA
jgi:hypothetical protein